MRIENAKEALMIFLKSLPADSDFNVVSFRSSSRKMFNSSVKYDETRLDKAINEI